MFVLAVAVNAHDLAHQRGRKLSVRRFDRADLVPGRFNRAGLVNVDVPRRCGNHALPRAKRGGDNDGICQRAAHDEVNVRIRAIGQFSDRVRRMTTKRVHAVAAGGFKIAARERFEDGRMRALGIVIAERNHDDLSFFCRFTGLS